MLTCALGPPWKKWHLDSRYSRNMNERWLDLHFLQTDKAAMSPMEMTLKLELFGEDVGNTSS